MNWLNWFHNKHQRPTNLDFDTFLAGALCTVNVIWTARNKVIHGNGSTPIHVAIESVRRLFQDHIPQRKQLNDLPKPGTRNSTKWINYTTDVSMGIDQSYGSAVFKDHTNKIEGIYMTSFYTTNPTIAEAEMLVFAATTASNIAYKNISFHCDNSVVVNYLNLPNEGPPHYLLEGVKTRFNQLCTTFEGSSLGWIARTLNFTAHNTAKWARLNLHEGELRMDILDEAILCDETAWDPG